MSKNNNKYKATEKGFKEVDDEEEEKVSTKAAKIPVEEDLSIPYPDKGGHSVAQLAGMEDHKRKAILGEKDTEFTKKYHL